MVLAVTDIKAFYNQIMDNTINVGDYIVAASEPESNVLDEICVCRMYNGEPKTAKERADLIVDALDEYFLAEWTRANLTTRSKFLDQRAKFLDRLITKLIISGIGLGILYIIVILQLLGVLK